MELSQRLTGVKRDLLRTGMKMVKAEETMTFLKECKVNGVLPTSISKIKLPVKSKTVLRKTKEVCLRVAYTDAKRNFYRLNQRFKELLESCEQAGETEFVDWAGERRSELKRRLRVKYVNKFKLLNLL